MARSKLGRPPLPEDERKRTITVYLGTRTVEQIEQQAARAGLSRNQVIATVLADYFGAAAKRITEQPDSVSVLGQDLPTARAAQSTLPTTRNHGAMRGG